ncbi:TPA: metallophosphoesterase family protein [Thermoplasmata archaeon]|nr:metallophosphoesterase family protein [Thermoplasmata archaeon]
MRVGVVSDIHSNKFALEVVLERLEELAPDSIVCAGDIVGYGAHPDECCRIAADFFDAVVQGNHDAAVLSGETSGMNPYAAAAALWTRDKLSPDSKALLGSLRTSSALDSGNGRVSIFHGSDRDRDEYVHEEMVDPDILARNDSRFIVLGHTHVPFVCGFPSGLVLNPGAVGQPRDGDPRASFALLDTEESACEVIRAEYPSHEASEAILKAGLPMMLAKRLSVGR